VSAHLVWATAGTQKAKTLASAPADVANVRLIVTGTGISGSISKEFPVAAGEGTLTDIPVGTGRTFVAQGLSSSNALLYEGASPNNPLTIQKGQTTEAGNIVMNPVSILAAPTGLTATAASSTQINLSWTDNSTNETGFKVERKTGSTGTWAQIATVAADVTSYSNTGLVAGTTYYYRVRAATGSGNSDYSNQASATVPGSFFKTYYDSANDISIDFIDITQVSLNISSSDVVVDITVRNMPDTFTFNLATQDDYKCEYFYNVLFDVNNDDRYYIEIYHCKNGSEYVGGFSEFGAAVVDKNFRPIINSLSKAKNGNTIRIQVPKSGNPLLDNLNFDSFSGVTGEYWPTPSTRYFDSLGAAQ
jgi:hypothetical protein